MTSCATGSGTKRSTRIGDRPSQERDTIGASKHGDAADAAAAAAADAATTTTAIAAATMAKNMVIVARNP